jgi:hypothetical protein
MNKDRWLATGSWRHGKNTLLRGGGKAADTTYLGMDLQRHARLGRRLQVQRSDYRRALQPAIHIYCHGMGPPHTDDGPTMSSEGASVSSSLAFIFAQASSVSGRGRSDSYVVLLTVHDA